MSNLDRFFSDALRQHWADVHAQADKIIAANPELVKKLGYGR